MPLAQVPVTHLSSASTHGCPFVFFVSKMHIIEKSLSKVLGQNLNMMRRSACRSIYNQSIINFKVLSFTVYLNASVN